jgi:Met-zincin
MQKDAVAFLNRHIFQTPEWLADRNIHNRINAPVSSQLGTIQDNLLSSLLTSSRLDRMIQLTNRFENGYPIEEYYSDLKKGIFSELSGAKKIDNHRRNLQKSYVERMTSLLNPAPASAPSSAGGISFSISFGPDVRKTDISSLTRAHLSSLRSEINTAAAATQDTMTKYHLQDLSDRIRKALDPK